MSPWLLLLLLVQMHFVMLLLSAVEAKVVSSTTVSYAFLLRDLLGFPLGLLFACFGFWAIIFVWGLVSWIAG